MLVSREFMQTPDSYDVPSYQDKERLPKSLHTIFGIIKQNVYSQLERKSPKTQKGNEKVPLILATNNSDNRLETSHIQSLKANVPTNTKSAIPHLAKEDKEYSGCRQAVLNSNFDNSIKYDTSTAQFQTAFHSPTQESFQPQFPDSWKAADIFPEKAVEKKKRKKRSQKLQAEVLAIQIAEKRMQTELHKKEAREREQQEEERLKQERKEMEERYLK
eukprot:Platyproteum_vivax@DN10125_c0_g1_i1.p1